MSVEVLLHYPPSISDRTVELVTEGVLDVFGRTTSMKKPQIVDRMVKSADFEECIIPGTSYYNAEIMTRRYPLEPGRFSLCLVPGSLATARSGTIRPVEGMASGNLAGGYLGTLFKGMQNIGNLPIEVASGSGVVSLPPGPKKRSEILIKTMHETGHMLGIVSAKRSKDGHCAKLCIMGSGQSIWGHPMKHKSLLDIDMHFCKDCNYDLGEK